MLGRCEAVVCDREDVAPRRCCWRAGRLRRRRARACARARAGVPDLVDMVPPDGATDVPLNATLGAHYTASADYLGEDVVLVHPDGREPQTLEADFDPTEQFQLLDPRRRSR